MRANTAKPPVRKMLLVTGPRGGELATATVRDAADWDALVSRFGLPELTRHGFRHRAQRGWPNRASRSTFSKRFSDTPPSRQRVAIFIPMNSTLLRPPTRRPHSSRPALGAALVCLRTACTPPAKAASPCLARSFLAVRPATCSTRSGGTGQMPIPHHAAPLGGVPGRPVQLCGRGADAIAKFAPDQGRCGGTGRVE